MLIKEVRNLRRWYLLDHSLFRYNKRNEPITRQQLAILLAIYFSSLSMPFVNTCRILTHLRDHKRAIRPDILSRQLKELERGGLINRSVVRRSNVYQITMFGLLELKEIEKLNRTCRQ